MLEENWQISRKILAEQQKMLEELRQSSGAVLPVPIMEFPLLPIDNEADLASMEHELANPRVYRALVELLRRLGGTHLNMATRLSLETTLSKSFACRVTWYGTTTKTRLYGTRLLKAVTEGISKVRSCAGVEGTDIKRAVTEWLRHSTQRLESCKEPKVALKPPKLQVAPRPPKLQVAPRPPNLQIAPRPPKLMVFAGRDDSSNGSYNDSSDEC